MSAMYPAGYDPSAVVAQAQSYAPQTAPSFSQMTPAYYGPTHAALSQAFQSALLNQMSNAGLLSHVTPQQMGLLSTDMPQASAVSMPATGGTPAAGPGQYYRLAPDFWNNVYQPPVAAPMAARTAYSTNANNPTVNNGHNGHNGYDSPSNGSHYLFGGGSSDYGRGLFGSTDMGGQNASDRSDGAW